MARVAWCRLGEDRFAIDLAALSGVERTDRLQRVPADPAGTVGWLLGPREDLPVFALARLLGRPDAPASDRGSGVVLVYPGGAGVGGFGLLADGVERGERPVEALHPLPEPFRNAGVSAFGGVAQADGALSLLLDVHEIGRRALRDPAADAGPEGRGIEAGRAPAGRGGREEEHGGAPPRPAGARRAARVLIADLFARNAAGRRISVAFAPGQVLEVIESAPVLAVPGSPVRLPGILLWRDRPLAVLDLARSLDGSARLSVFGRAERFVIVATPTAPVAVPVGRDVRFERLSRSAPAAGAAPADRRVLGAFDLPDSLLLVFDLALSLAGADLA